MHISYWHSMRSYSSPKCKLPSTGHYWSNAVGDIFATMGITYYVRLALPTVKTMIVHILENTMYYNSANHPTTVLAAKYLP